MAERNASYNIREVFFSARKRQILNKIADKMPSKSSSENEINEFKENFANELNSLVVMKDLLREYPHLLQYAGPIVMDDFNLIIDSAISTDPSVIQYLVDDPKWNNWIKNDFIKENSLNLKYIPFELQNGEMVLDAVSRSGYALEYADPNLIDKEIALAAVSQNGLALQYLPPELRKDPEIVMAAVKQNGIALRFADETLQDKKDIVITAINKNRNAIIHASPNLKKDEDVLNAYCKEREDNSSQERESKHFGHHELFYWTSSKKTLSISELLASAPEDELLLPYNKNTFSKEDMLNDVIEDTERLKLSYTEIYGNDSFSYGGCDADFSLKEEGYALKNGYLAKYKNFLASEEFLKKALFVMPGLYNFLPQNAQVAASKYLKNKDLAFSLILESPGVLGGILKDLKIDKKFALDLINENPKVFNYPQFRMYDSDKDILHAVFMLDASVLKENNIDAVFTVNIEDAKLAAANSADTYDYLLPEMQNNLEVKKIILSKDALLLERMDEETQKNEDIVGYALAHCKNCWHIPSISSLRDPSFVFRVYESYPEISGIRYDINRKIDSYDIIRAAIIQPEILKHFRFPEDHSCAKPAIISKPNILKYLTPDYIPTRYLKDKAFEECIWEYSKTNPIYINTFKGENMLGREKRMAEVMANNLEYIPEIKSTILNNPAFASELFKLNPQMLDYKDRFDDILINTIIHSESLAVETVSLNGLNLQYMDKSHIDKENVVSEAVEQNPESIIHASERLQNDDVFLAKLAVKNPEILNIIPVEKSDNVKALMNNVEKQNNNKGRAISVTDEMVEEAEAPMKGLDILDEEISNEAPENADGNRTAISTNNIGEDDFGH